MTDVDVPDGKPDEEQANDGISATEERIALTASQEELGMKIYQPDSNIRDETARLHAVPSEKLRAWTGWLSKVGERADEWHWWLRSQIRFTVEMNELLRRAAAALREQKSEGKNSRHSDATDGGEGIEATGVVEEGREQSNGTTDGESLADPTRSFSSSVPRPSELTGSKTGSERRAEKVAERRGLKSSEREDQQGARGSETSEEARVNYKEGFWPIGTRWEPTSRSMPEQQSSPSKREPDKVRIPADETTMRASIDEIVRQGLVYRKLYKHWSATGDQAVKEIVGRAVMPTNRVYSNGEEEVPYCFYLEASSSDNDDDAVLSADEGRERISREFNYLYFNLSDKPARGG